jgi:hypothetical protein
LRATDLSGKQSPDHRGPARRRAATGTGRSPSRRMPVGATPTWARLTSAGGTDSTTCTPYTWRDARCRPARHRRGAGAALGLPRRANPIVGAIRRSKGAGVRPARSPGLRGRFPRRHPRSVAHEAAAGVAGPVCRTRVRQDADGAHSHGRPRHRRRARGARRPRDAAAGDPHVRQRQHARGDAPADVRAECEAGSGSSLPGPELPGQSHRPRRPWHTPRDELDAAALSGRRGQPRHRGLPRGGRLALARGGHPRAWLRAGHRVLR